MAIRERKGRKKPWEVYWNNPFTLKRESLYVETEEEAKKQDALKKYQLKYERELFRKEDAGDQKGKHTLESAYYLYLKEKQFGKIMLGSHLSAMKRALKLYGSRPLCEITTEDLKNFKAHLMGLALKGTSVRRHLSLLRTVLRWCEAEGLLEASPKFPSLPVANYEKFIPPSQEELTRLLYHAAPHIRRVIILGSQCGMRVGPSELFRLKWEHVDIPNRVIHVPAAKKNIHEPWRDVPIKKELLPLLEEWRQADMDQSVVWVIHFRGKPVRWIEWGWNNALRRAGIARKIRPYDLRHAFATEAIAAGVDIGTVARLMGHRSPVMILNHYQHVMDSQKRAAVEALPSLSHVAKDMWQKEKTS